MSVRCRSSGFFWFAVPGDNRAIFAVLFGTSYLWMEDGKWELRTCAKGASELLRLFRQDERWKELM